MSEDRKQIAIFKGKQIRRVWDEVKEKWYFSVVDVVAALSGSSIPKRYWSDLKRKLLLEGSQMYEKIVHLKLLSSDGKKYLDEIAFAWAGMTTKQYKNFKELTKENLRDNMTNLELILKS